MQSLLTAAGVQFGGHFAKNIAPLKLHFSEDILWDITTTKWGLLQSAVTLPCIFFPWMLGRTVDRKRNVKKVLVASLVVVCIGELMFIMAAKNHWFTVCLMGRFVFGVGEGLVSSLSVYIAATSVPKYKMTAIGLTQSFHALAVACSKASLAYFAKIFHSYIAALVISLGVCCASLAVGCLWHPKRTPTRGPASCHTDSSNTNDSLSLDFWLVAGIHLMFSSSHRLFGHIDAPFLTEKFGHSVSIAGYTSSITEFVAMLVAPPMGLFLDKYCSLRSLPRILFACSCIGGMAYMVLTSQRTGLAALEGALVCIGIVNGISPTVMKSIIPETVDVHQLAYAFGIYEASEAIGVVVGSVIVGEVADMFFGSYNNCVLIFAGLLLICSVLAGIFVIRRTHQSTRYGYSHNNSRFTSCNLYNI